MTLTADQRKFLAGMGAPARSPGQTRSQALNLAASSFREACFLGGMVPLPSVDDVLAELPDPVIELPNRCDTSAS